MAAAARVFLRVAPEQALSLAADSDWDVLGGSCYGEGRVSVTIEKAPDDSMPAGEESGGGE